MDQIHMAGPSITDHEEAVVLDAIRNGWYEKAYAYVEKFEKEFARFHDRKFGLMTPNCTSAIHLLLLGLGIGEGDEVIVPDCTWIGSSAPITYVRARPVFCDIEIENWCLDPQSVEERITARTKAIIAVGLYGNMPRMDELLAIAERHSILLIEDAAESLGSTYRGVKSGKFGIGSVFSFHRTKTLTTGEGGMLLLDDEELYNRCSMLRDHGRKRGGPLYYFYQVTPKYMPFNVQAALGYAQFQRLGELVEKKRHIFHRYQRQLSDIDDLQLNNEPEGVFNSIWMTAVVFGKTHNMTKARAMEELSKLGLPSRPFFYPLTSLPAYAEFAAEGAKNWRAYDISSRAINLPAALNLTDQQVDAVCAGIRSVLNRSNMESNPLPVVAAES